MVYTIKFFLYIIYVFITVAIMSLLAATIIVYMYGRNLPDYRQLNSCLPSSVTRVYSADGLMISELSREYRVFLPIKHIPQHVINAFIAAEDKNFYENSGIDILSIAKAAIKNLYKVVENKRMAGGSTITQQVVKNFLLNNERTISRKIKEAILAYRITSSLSKDRIMELYVNQIYLGNGIYGVAAAALKYFDKSVNDLSLGEIALIAALPKAPSRINPIKNPELALLRRNWVLQRMYEDGHIDEIAKKIAQSEKINTAERSNKNFVSNDFFSEEIRKTLIRKYGEDAVYGNGMSVYSTMSIEYQKFAKKALMEGLEEYDKRHGWRGAIANIKIDPSDSVVLLNNFHELKKNNGCSFCVMGFVSAVYADYADIILEDMSYGVIKLSKTKWAKRFIDNDTTGPAIKSMNCILQVGDVIFVKKEINNNDEYLLHQVPKVNGAIIVIEPSTGRVLAMSGGYSYEDNQFNRATQAFRQPGSVFKTFVYLSAFENGLMPNTVVLDDHLYIDQGPGMPLWQPRNIGNTFLGPITVRASFEKSRNLSTIRIARFVGMENITKITNKLNIYSSSIKNYATLLGSEVVSLMTITRAYAIIANGGYDINCHLIDRIQNVYGSDLYKENYATCDGCNLSFKSKIFNMLTPLPPEVHMNKPQIIDPVYAYQMTSLLEGAVKRGTAMPAYIKNQYIAGKTGTTNHNMDAWFIGFTNDMVVGVYVGFDVPETLGKRETGSRVALPIFKKFMQNALQNKQSKPFKIPLGINIVEVDSDTGMPIKKIKNIKNVQTINEAFVVGDENKIISLIERKHYYDENKNRWMVELEEDYISEIIRDIAKTLNKK